MKPPTSRLRPEGFEPNMTHDSVSISWRCTGCAAKIAQDVAGWNKFVALSEVKLE